jgi:hypothetical protein
MDGCPAELAVRLPGGTAVGAGAVGSLKSRRELRRTGLSAVTPFRSRTRESNRCAQREPRRRTPFARHLLGACRARAGRDEQVAANGASSRSPRTSLAGSFPVERRLTRFRLDGTLGARVAASPATAAALAAARRRDARAVSQLRLRRHRPVCLAAACRASPRRREMVVERSRLDERHVPERLADRRRRRGASRRHNRPRPGRVSAHARHVLICATLL